MLPREAAPSQTHISKTRGEARAGAAKGVAPALGHSLGPQSPLPREQNTQSGCQASGEHCAWWLPPHTLGGDASSIPILCMRKTQTGHVACNVTGPSQVPILPGALSGQALQDSRREGGHKNLLAWEGGRAQCWPQAVHSEVKTRCGKHWQ